MSKRDKKLLWVHPCVNCGCDCDETEENHYHISLELPGVQKESIDLRVIETGMRLRAARSENEDFVSELKFLCTVKASEAKAHFKDDLLEVIVPFDCPDPFKEVTPLEIT